MAMQFISTYLLCLLPVLVLLYYILKPLNRKQQFVLPPSPPKLPIIGNLHQLGSLPHKSLAKLSKKYGSVMLLQLGSVPTVVVSSSDTAKQVLKVHDLDSCSRPQLPGTGRLSYDGLDIAFAPFGDYWRQMRKLCVLELFSVRRVESFQYVREEEIGLMVDSISEASNRAVPVDLSQMLMYLTANVIYRSAFGKRFRSSELHGSKFKQAIEDAYVVLGSFAASDFFPYVGPVVDRITGFHSYMERTFRLFDTLYQQAINDHLAKEMAEGDQEDFIDVMLKIQREHAETTNFTHNHMKGILMNVFLAGVDTSAITTDWAMAELINKPQEMKKVQDEIRRVVGNKGKVSAQDICQLEYLKLVIKETLRLHPAGPLLISRQTTSHFKINGYDILPGTRLHVNVWAIGRDPILWENPEEFIPERFVDSEIDYKGQNYEYLPFGSGRRMCPGMYMGITMVELALANLLYCFDWKLPDDVTEGVNMDEAGGLTIHKKVPLKLVSVKYKCP